LSVFSFLIPEEWTNVPWIAVNGFFCDPHIITEADIKHPDSSEDGTGNVLARLGRLFFLYALGYTVYNTKHWIHQCGGQKSVASAIAPALLYLLHPCSRKAPCLVPTLDCPS
jgi:hypothetical protein